MYLRGSSCPSCFPEKHSTSVPRLHPSRACRAFRSPWPWKVWRVAPARSVLRGALAPLPLPGREAAPHIPISQSANQPISGAATPPLRSHRRQGRRPGLQPLWLLQASKHPNFQASLTKKNPPGQCPWRGGVVCLCRRMSKQHVLYDKCLTECKHFL